MTLKVERIGNRRELFVDQAMIHSTTARFVLQKPVKRENCFSFDAPYEGTGNAYPVIIKVDGKLRMYYKGAHLTSDDGKEIYISKEERKKNPFIVGVLESVDGIHWERPSLGIIEYRGNKDNNIVWADEFTDNFIPFIDTRPGCPDDEKYKAFSGHWRKLYTYKSADGLRWSKISEEPLSITGTFDSSNLGFWDPIRGKYWAFVRNFHGSDQTEFRFNNDINYSIRDISWCQSDDFIHWSEPELLDFGNAPDIPLYVSAITRYERAPHLFLGFPTRYYDHLEWKPFYDQLPGAEHRRNRMEHHPRYGLSLTDCIFMSSRDGKRWNRTEEAFIKPGIHRDTNWCYGDGYLTIGIAETPSAVKGEPNELSIYSIADFWKGTMELHRYTLRQDGFVALTADAQWHNTITKPFIFEGSKLTLNVSTTIMGGMKVELQDVHGEPIAGFTEHECDLIIGDRLDYVVSWNNDSDVSRLSGKPIRMRFIMNDVELFSYKFE